MDLPKFHLNLRTPDKTFFDGEVNSVKLETALGQTEIFSNHAPLIGSIGFSRVIVRAGEHETDFLIRQGLVFVDALQNTVSMLAYYCEEFAEVDPATIAEYTKLILEKFKDKKDLNKYQLTFLEDQKVSAEKMLEVVQTHENSKQQKK